MATDPAFAATVLVGSGLVNATLDTSLTAPSNITTIVTAGASGSRIEELVLQAVGTTSSGVVNVFRYDGSTYHLIDQFVVTAVTSSTTAAAWRATKTYANLILANGDSLRVTNTVSGNQSMIKVSAFGGSL